jgi:peptidoglycan/LPS O-acetylase OafA/YrhL
MGHRYAAFMLGLVAALWLARNAPNTQARRALMIGALAALALTTVIRVETQ